jgi:hypothetical protein
MITPKKEIRANGLACFASVSEPRQSGIAQTDWIAFAPLGCFDDARRDGLVIGLSGASDLLARGVERFAHGACNLGIERSVVGPNEGQNGRHVIRHATGLASLKR